MSISRKILAVTVVSALASLMAFGAVQASAATLKNETSAKALLAIYGNPGSNGEGVVPVGGGLGRNFGFGENMLFRANTTAEIGKNLAITLGGKVAEARDSYIGGTLMSNKTGEGNPLSFVIQFSDFQANLVEGVATQSYSDTFDRPWISEICGVSEGTKTKECRIDPLFTEAQQEGRTVKIEDVAFNLGPGIVVQGTVWGKWVNGASKKAPCIKLELPAKAVAEKSPDETLSATQPVADLGASIEAISGEACLISANNDWYNFGTPAADKSEPAITIKNE
ncbi:MAG: hypothetical protein ACRDK7_15495 [Solirubrobacteraceae bacterium]